MPLKNGRFTPQELDFIDKMAATGDATYAAEKARYGTPARRASQALANPAIVDEIRRLQQQRLHAEVLPLAVDQHIALLKDERTPAGAKGNLIATAYKYGLAEQPEANADEPHTWTAEQLAERIARLKHLRDELNRPTLELEAAAPEGGGIFD